MRSGSAWSPCCRHSPDVASAFQAASHLTNAIFSPAFCLSSRPVLRGTICPPNLATYAATKAFITHHTANLAEELRHTPVGFTKVEIGEVADTGLMDKGRTDPTFTALVQRLYRLRLSRLITPQEITKHTLAAIEQERLSVRLPRRIGLSSYLVDAPRTLSALAARDLRRGARQGAA